MIKVSLDEIMGGGLQEQFQKAFDNVIRNLADPNTSFKEARKITITLKFTQNEARDDASCAVTVVEKLAAQAPVQTAFSIGRNLKTGEMYAEEYGRHNRLKGQMTVEEIDVPVDPATGEVIEEKSAEPVVVDFRKAIAK